MLVLLIALMPIRTNTDPFALIPLRKLSVSLNLSMYPGYLKSVSQGKCQRIDLSTTHYKHMVDLI